MKSNVLLNEAQPRKYASEIHETNRENNTFTIYSCIMAIVINAN
jgi:hypothetical protein